MDIKKSYKDLLGIRRSLRGARGYRPPFITYSNYGGAYQLHLTIKNFYYHAEIEGAEDIAHFEQYVKPHCDKPDMPRGTPIESHSFSNKADWINQNESIYNFYPLEGQEFLINDFYGVGDNNAVFGENETFNFVVWQSLTAPCPVFNNAKTPFNDGFDPATFTGWISADDRPGQKGKHYAYLIGGVPQYAVVHFEFGSLEELKTRAPDKFIDTTDHTAQIFFPYKENDTLLFLRSSMNERIEVFYTNHSGTDPVIPSPNGALNKMYAEVSIYDEF